MLPAHPFRFPVCSPSGGVQSIFQPEPGSPRGGGGVGSGSGLSPSEIVKRKLHQRLMAGQAKKRRLSSSSSEGAVPLHPEPSPPRIPQAAAPSDAVGGGSESRSGDPKERTKEIPMSMEDSSGSSLSSAVGRLSSVSNNAAILPPSSATSDLCSAAVRTSLPQSAGTMPFSAIIDTNKYASVSTVPFETQPMQHIAATVEGLEASVTVPTASIGSTNASDIGRLSAAAAVNSLGEIFRYSEHQKVRKKKSRRPPKVKKIKFHEYKGPHRRTAAATQKLLSESNGKMKTENPVPKDSRPTPICSAGIETNRHNSSSVGPLNAEKPAVQNIRGTTDVSISQEAVSTSHRRRQQVANPESSQNDEPERSDRLVGFEKHSVDPGLCSSISKSSELRTSLAPQSNPTVPLLNAAPRAVNPAVQPIAQAGISAPLLITAAAVSRRKEKIPKTDIRATDVGEKKTLRGKTSAVLTAPVTLDDLKVAELKEECKSRRLSVSGPKPRLVNRLMPFSDAILEQRRLPAMDDASKSKCLPCFPPSTGKAADCKGTRTVPEFQSIFHQTLSPNFNQNFHSVPKETNNGNDNNDDDDDDDEDDNDDNDCDDGDEGSTSSLCPNAAGHVHPKTVKCIRTDAQRSTRPLLGDDVIRSHVTVTSSYVDSTTGERRRPGGLTHRHRPQPQPTTQPETDASRIQQQLLTPPTTPTHVSGHVGLRANCESFGNNTVTCGNNGTGIDAGRVGGGLGVGLGVGGGVGGGLGVGGGSRWLYHVTSNGVPVTVTDSELWTMQERQIADLQQQLLKTKAQLICARTKARLDQCFAAAVDGYRLPLFRALIGGGGDGGLRRGSSVQQQAKCLSEEARLALSSAIDNAERVFDGLKRDARAKHPVGIISASSSSSSSAAHLHPLSSGSIDFGGSPGLGSVPAPSNDGTQPTGPLGPEESTLEHQDNLYESSSDVNETSDSLATDSDESEQLPVRCSWYIPPARKPPDYYEAMQQKLMQSRSMLMAKEMEEPRGVSMVSLSVPSIDVSLRPTIVTTKEEEEIEDVLEVLLRSGELNATEILPERLIWQQDPTADFTKEGRHALSHAWHIPQNTGSQQRLSDNDSYEGSECTPDERPDSTVETIHYKACRVTGGGGPTVTSNNNSLGRNPVVKEENPPSMELAELFFDWSDVEYVNRSNVNRFFDSIPDESIFCPTINREPITFPDYSLVNGCDWPGAGDAIPGGPVRAEDWSVVTPCDSMNSSGCNSTNDDDPVPADQRFLLDGKLGVLSPGLTPTSTVAANEAETERSFGDPLEPRTNDAYHLRDGQSEGEWMEEFVDSKNFHAPTHLTVNNNPSSILSAFSFLQ